jgi:CheY-like chemotaxis protein
MSSTGTDGGSGLIFVAEDDDHMREMLATALTAQGYEVRAVCDGQALIDRLAHDHDGDQPGPIAIITDLRMPRRDGLAVLAVAQRFVPEVPVILMTAFGEPTLHKRAYELGAARVFDKPVTLRALSNALRELT